MSPKKLQFCANLSTMYVKEATCLLERYALAANAGFKGVECAFPYEFKPEELAAARASALVLASTYDGAEDDATGTPPEECVAALAPAFCLASSPDGAEADATGTRQRNWP